MLNFEFMITKARLLFLMIFLSINLFVLERLDALIFDEIVAIVGRNIITEYDVRSRIGIIEFFNRQKLNPKDQVIRKMIIESLIDEILISNQAKKLDISVSEEDFSRLLFYILQQSRIDQGDFIQSLEKESIGRIALSNFIKHKVLVQKISDEKLEKELKYSNLERLSFKDKAIEKLNIESMRYRIMILSNNSKIVEEKSDFQSCQVLQEFLQDNGYGIQVNEVFNKIDMNAQILEQIRISDKKYGLIKNGKVEIAFCVVPDSHKIIDITNEQLDFFYKNELLKRASQQNLEILRQNNFILIKN